MGKVQPGRAISSGEPTPARVYCGLRWPAATSNSTSTSSSSAPDSAAASARTGWWRRATASRSWRWAAAGPPRSPAHQLVDSSLVLASQAGAARLLQHALLPPRHHPARLRRRRRLDYLRRHLAAPAGQNLGHRDRGTAWRTGKRRCRGTMTAASTHAGRHREQDPRPGGPSAEASGGSRGRWTNFLSHQRGDLPGAGRRAGRHNLSRSLLRRRRSGAHHLQRLRRLHDGLPPRRQEYARHELSLPGGKARRASFSGNASGGRAAARRRGRRQRRL